MICTTSGIAELMIKANYNSVPLGAEWVAAASDTAVSRTYF